MGGSTETLVQNDVLPNINPVPAQLPDVGGIFNELPEGFDEAFLEALAVEVGDDEFDDNDNQQ
jgi:hypothetical protein